MTASDPLLLSTNGWFREAKLFALTPEGDALRQLHLSQERL
jgi:hypothetical protein